MTHLRSESEVMQNWPKDEKPLVTVCCATYNQERYIENTIKSFLLQETNFPFEVIIHDDASTDKTSDIVKKYAQKYPKIICPIYQTKNQYSQGKKILPNLFKLAKGKYLAICEGDDYWIDSKKLSIQVSKMKEYPECHISFHAVNETLNNANESLSPNPRSIHYEKEQIFDVKTVLAGGGSFMQTPSIMLYKEAVEKLPAYYYSAPAGDYVLQFLGSLNGGALYINKIMAVYRVGAEGSWRKSIEDSGNYIRFQSAWVESYLTINQYYNQKYEKEIFTVLKTKTEYLAKFIFIEKHDYRAFNKFIDIAYKIEKRPSVGLKISYNLRSFPLILNLYFYIERIIEKLILKLKVIILKVINFLKINIKGLA